jgi:prepilin-type N-terminal cleavage/methylation domain-containing protein
MRHFSRGFTLIELLVVVAIIGILSAVGVTSYSGYKASAEKKQAEITLHSIYLAEQEYKSNNGEYCISECSNNAGIIDKLFDGVDDLDGQKYTFKTTSADTLTIIATKIKDTSCTIKITQNIKKPNRSSSC